MSRASRTKSTLRPHRPQFQKRTEAISGISESERERRKKSNVLTTKINFLAWLIEVISTSFKNLKTVFLQCVGVTTVLLDLPFQTTLFRALTHIVAPLFYICAAEKDKLKKVRLRQLLGLPQNNIQPVTQSINMANI